MILIIIQNNKSIETAYCKETIMNDCWCDCIKFMFCLYLIFVVTLIQSISRGKIDEYGLDNWDREYGLDPCCYRDNVGIIRNRNTNEVETYRMRKDLNPYWVDDSWAYD